MLSVFDGVMDHDHDDNNAQVFNQGGGGGGSWEIEESEMSLEVVEVEAECVHVVVGKSETSMEALSWTLKHLITSPSTMLYLMHVLPEIKYIPNPLGMGMIPKNQVNEEQIEIFEAQELAKRRELLSKFLQLCSSSQVKVDTILIESDTVAKAILELVPILNIQNLVIGINKSRKPKSKKGKIGIAEQIIQNVPGSCRVRIVSEGKEVNHQEMLAMMSSPSPRVATPNSNDHNDNHQVQTRMPMKEDQDHHQNGPVSCHCFLKPTYK